MKIRETKIALAVLLVAGLILSGMDGMTVYLQRLPMNFCSTLIAKMERAVTIDGSNLMGQGDFLLLLLQAG